jgi:hypothetical protein
LIDVPREILMFINVESFPIIRKQEKGSIPAASILRFVLIDGAKYASP